MIFLIHITCLLKIVFILEVEIEDDLFWFTPNKPYTCQISRLRCEFHAHKSKTPISRQLTPMEQFHTPDLQIWAISLNSMYIE